MRKNHTCWSRSIRGFVLLVAGLAVLAVASHRALAYDTYSGDTGATNCFSCHGDFRGPTSTKGTVFPSNNNHEMHRNTGNMGTTCNLCHTGDSSTRWPVFIRSSNGTANNTGVGCTGCHVAVGLRKHHVVNGITVCLNCHKNDPAPPAETVKPPYYSTADTKVRNPGNTVRAASTNENWSLGDFIGLDNDGNNLYDYADYAVGPRELLSTTIEGNNLRLTWQTAGGRTNTIQAATSVAGPYTSVSPAIKILGEDGAPVTTNYLVVGGATNLLRFFRTFTQVP